MAGVNICGSGLMKEEAKEFWHLPFALDTTKEVSAFLIVQSVTCRTHVTPMSSSEQTNDGVNNTARAQECK